jgi:hypothetical protein
MDMSSKKERGAKFYVLVAAVIGLFIIAEWISVFFFGHIPPGYP